MNTKETDHSLEEKSLSSQKIFSGNLLHVYKDEVRLPDGSTSHREWIDHPGACAVLPIFRSGEVQLVKQFRYPLRQNFIEVPAGKIDPGEDPLVTAKRELEEESGIRAKNWVPLGGYHPCIGYTNEKIYLYLAWDLEVSEICVDEDEFLKPVRIPFVDAITEVFSGEITDGKTMANILRGAKWWMENAPFPVALKL